MTLINSLFVGGIVRYASMKQNAVVEVAESELDTTGLDTQTVLTKSPMPSVVANGGLPAKTATPSKTVVPTPSKAPTVAKTTVSPTPVAATPKPTTAATATPAPTPTPAASGCVVTIDGASYNITSLVKSHSGGNVFKCGTDMSGTFNGASPRHKISWMTKYKI